MAETPLQMSMPDNVVVWQVPIAGHGTMTLLIASPSPLPADSVKDLEQVIRGLEAWRTALALRVHPMPAGER